MENHKRDLGTYRPGVDESSYPPFSGQYSCHRFSHDVSDDSDKDEMNMDGLGLECIDCCDGPMERMNMVVQAAAFPQKGSPSKNRHPNSDEPHSERPWVLSRIILD
jgi:hypothetical protein